MRVTDTISCACLSNKCMTQASVSHTNAQPLCTPLAKLWQPSVGFPYNIFHLQCIENASEDEFWLICCIKPSILMKSAQLQTSRPHGQENSTPIQPLYLKTTKITKGKVKHLTYLSPCASLVLCLTTMVRKAPRTCSDCYSSAMQMSDIWPP